MEGREIKKMIEKLGPGAVLIFTGTEGRMTVRKSFEGELRLNGNGFITAPVTIDKATAWVKSIRPHCVVDDSEFETMKTALGRMGESLALPLVRGIPESYQNVTWRGTLAVSQASNEIGISFNSEEGTAIRLRLSMECAKHVSETLSDYILTAEKDQKDKSSGMLSFSGSTPDEGE